MSVTASQPRAAARPLPARTVTRSVLRRGLLDGRRSILTWGGSLAVYGAFMAAIYPSLREGVSKALEGYPENLKKAFDIQDVNTVEAYLHGELFSLIVPFAIGFFAVRWVARATSAAEEQGYLDTTLALPLSRRTLTLSSFGVMALLSMAVLAVMGLGTWAVGSIAGTDISFGLTAAGVVGVWPLAVFFGGVAMVAAGVMHRGGTVTGTAIGVLVAMYALDLAGRIAPSVDFLRWASVFRFYGAPIRDGIDPAHFFGITAAGLLLLAIGTVLFERRDVLR